MTNVRVRAALLVVLALLVGPLVGGSRAAGGPPVAAVSTATDHACALLADGTVRCWGQNNRGQLGDGTRTARLTPVAVKGLADVTSVSTSYGYTCAVVSAGAGGGTVKCWGSEQSSATGWRRYGEVPVTVSGVANAIAVSAGGAVACALLSDHTVSCWGDNSRGEMGDGTRATSSSPVVVPGLSGVQAVAVGDASACAVMQADGSVRCWGSAGDYVPDIPNDLLTPVAVPGLTGAVSVSADPYQSCALLDSGTVDCWAIGSGMQPSQLSGLTGVKQFAYARDGQQTDHTCVLLAGGRVECRSPDPYEGQIGNGTTKPNGDKLVAVTGLRNATMISASDFYTCAVRSTGSVECWGGNTGGVLGDGTATNRTRPVPLRWSPPIAVLGHRFVRSAGFGHAHPAYVSYGGADEEFKLWKLHWRHWGQPRAIAFGKAWWLPRSAKSISQGHLARAEAVAFDLGICQGRLSYLKLEWFFPGHGEHFNPAHGDPICDL
jgi:alpha-tubulin suppressor-like RCC1 family protein